MIEIVYKENKEQANGNEGYFHLPKNIRQVVIRTAGSGFIWKIMSEPF